MLEKSLSIGLGYNTFGGRDQLSVAANWGEPNEDSFGFGLDDQYTFELFYRLQLTKQLAITPDIQYLDGIKGWSARNQRGIFKFLRATGLDWLI